MSNRTIALLTLFAFLQAAPTQALTLRDAVELGIRFHPNSTRAENARIRAANGVTITEGEWKPQVSIGASASYTHLQPDPGFFPSDRTGASIRVQQQIPLDWPWEWGRSTANIKAARLLEEAASKDVFVSHINTAMTVINEYFIVLRLIEQERIAFNLWLNLTQIWEIARERASACILSAGGSASEIIPLPSETNKDSGGNLRTWTVSRSTNETEVAMAWPGYDKLTPEIQSSCGQLISDEREVLSSTRRAHSGKRGIQSQLRDAYYSLMVGLGMGDAESELRFDPNTGRPLIPDTMRFPDDYPVVPGSHYSGPDRFARGKEDAIFEMRNQSPVLLAARDRIDSAFEAVRNAPGIGDPSLSITGSYGTNDFHDRQRESRSASVVLTLSIPILDWGIRDARKSDAITRQSDALASRVEQERLFRRKISSLYNFFEIAEPNIQASREAVESLAAVNEDRVRQYQNGTLTLPMGQILGGIGRESGIRQGLVNEETLMYVNRYDVLSVLGSLIESI